MTNDVKCIILQNSKTTKRQSVTNGVKAFDRSL